MEYCSINRLQDFSIKSFALTQCVVYGYVNCQCKLSVGIGSHKIGKRNEKKIVVLKMSSVCGLIFFIRVQWQLKVRF